MTTTLNPNWLASKEMTDWLGDVDFPYTTAQAMIRYIRVQWPTLSRNMVIMDGQLPQSYVYWWCHCRENYRQTRVATPTYQCFEKWNNPDIVSTFLTWLDLLYIDITILNDEMHREGVPRLYGEHVLFVKSDPEKRRTRRETVQYIVTQGSVIFKERGFTEGLHWWEEKCTLTKSL